MVNKIKYLGNYFLKHELVVGSLYIFSGSIFGNFLAFILNLFLARNLSYADYAIFASLLSVITLAAIPASSINTVIVKFATAFFVKEQNDKLKTLYLLFFKLVLGLSLFIIFLFFVFSIPFKNYLHIDNAWYIIASGFVIAAFYLSTLNTAFLQSLLKFKFMAITNIAGSILKLTVGVVLVALGYKVFGGLGALFSMMSGMYLISYFPLSNILKEKSSAKKISLNIKQMLSYAVPAFVTTLFLTSFVSIDVILVKHFFNPHMAGFYAGLSLMGKVIVVDSLERGHRGSVDSNAKLIVGNLLDKEFVSSVFKDNRFDAVIHFSGYISMGESMENPYIYFQNNFLSSLNLMEEMVKTKTDRLIFSSTAGVYGNPIKLPISEDHPKNPENPYGESKLMVEKLISWYQKTHGLNSVVLRYFNASGASLDGKLGENHNPESHIIPNVIKAILTGSVFKLFGTNYDTKDGTCVRDYIHVVDLVEAHVLAVEKLMKDKGMFVYNVGTGNGHSNREIIEMAKKISGKDLQVEESERRPGDANALIADASKIKRELGFNPKYSDLETIVKTAWKWHSELKNKNEK